MKIKLSPVSQDEQLTASVSGDVVIVNGSVLDFTPLQEGDTLPNGAVGNRWIQGSVQRINGEIHITLVLPHGQNAPHETRYPAAFSEPITVLDGEVPLPPYDAPEPEQEPQPEWEPGPMPDAFIAGGAET